jgi:GR25 family glycosyltransferase involved in LPS biosynthesis
VSTNSHGCLVVTFPALHIYFIYIKHVYFVTFMKYILENCTCKRLIRLIASYDMVHWYVWYNGHGLTILVNFMVSVCVEALDPMVS